MVSSRLEYSVTAISCRSRSCLLGIKTFAVMSNSEKAFSPDYSKTDRKIRKLQKKLAPQQSSSGFPLPDQRFAVQRNSD